MSYDPTTSAGQVRLLISDVDPDNEVFSDDEITAFLNLPGVDDDVLLAAAHALDTIATNTALTLKVIKTLDLETDGAKLALSLRNHATQLRVQAATTGDDFAIAEYSDGPFAYRERLAKQAVREGLI